MSESKDIKLSDLALEILRETSKTPKGYLKRYEIPAGTFYEASLGQVYGSRGAELAETKAALNELLSAGLLRQFSQDTFKVTTAGFEYLEQF